LSLSLADVLEARKAIAGKADRTPLVASPYLSERAGREVLLKLELAQSTGAFKLRGAINALSRLPFDVQGVTCCSTGNHGRSVAFAARERKLRAVICMSRLVPQNKVEAIRALGAEVRIVGGSQDDAQVESSRLVEEEGLAEIPPFDDPGVIAGQGTIGLELLEARPDLVAILIPLSGGGLAAGVALAAKAIKPSIRIIGITMDRGAAMHESIRAGRPVEVREVESLADSLGGGVGLTNRVSFALCRDLLDATVLVDEAAIYRGMQAHFFEDRLICEGAAAVGAAALLERLLDLPPGPVATILTGRNVDMNVLSAVAAGRDVVLGNAILKGRPHAA
jgi:threonine dehydratase